MKTSFRKLALAAAGIAVATVATGVHAASFPAKDIVMVVPYTPGGSADVMTRAMALRLSKAWGVNIVVDNRAGASGMIGAELVAKAQPDGHMLLGTTSSYPATAAVRKKLPFDPANAIVPLSTTARAPNLLAVHPALPVKSVKDLVELAKKNPGKLTYSSSGTGGNNHFSGALFAAAAGIKTLHVPYKGIAQAVTSVAAGEVDMVISSSAALLPMVSANKVRLLGVTSLEPSPLFPDLPAVAQSGAPGYEYYLWWGLFAPAGISPEIVAKVNADANRILATADMKEFLRKQGAEPWPQTPAQLKDLLPKEIARYRKAMEIAGIQPQ